MTWPAIVRQVREFDEAVRSSGSVAWYRGHALARWPLTSTLHRWLEWYASGFVKPLSTAAKIQLLRAEYKTLYRRFKAEAWPLLDQRERSDWGNVFAMQHYGQPTRLLDWTESFACALYFAQFRRKPNRSAAIWAVDPQALNTVSVGFNGLVALDEDMSLAKLDSRRWHPKWLPPKKKLPTIAVSPVFTNPRMTAQRAAFTISGDSFDSLDVEFPALVRNGALRKFVLPPITDVTASEFLRVAGLNAFSFFPDLYGLALRHEAETENRIRDAGRWYPTAYKPKPKP